MSPSIAIISDGKLILADPSGGKRSHESTFAEDMISRQQKMAEKNAWKQGNTNPFFGGSMLWGNGDGSPLPRPRIVAVSRGTRPESVIYVLWTGVVGAMLDYDLDEAYEQRIFHREGFQAAELDRHPLTEKLVCKYGDGEISHIAVLDPDGRNLQPITEGDSLDGSPSWDPVGEHRIVFHSAGVSRDRNGWVYGFGNFCIERLNLKTGEMETIAEDDAHDLLVPRLDADGNLYFIRRPYEGPGGKSQPIWKTFKDVLFFPFRLFRAIIDFCNIFSKLVSQKPLTSSGGPKRKGPEPLQMWMYGRMINVEESSKNDKDGGALAPADWVLIKRSSNGEETQLATNALAYDICDEGQILYSDGHNLYVIGKDGKKHITRAALVEDVRWIKPKNQQAAS